jgi:hypothetical protein
MLVSPAVAKSRTEASNARPKSSDTKTVSMPFPLSRRLYMEIPAFLDVMALPVFTPL